MDAIFASQRTKDERPKWRTHTASGVVKRKVWRGKTNLQLLLSCTYLSKEKDAIIKSSIVLALMAVRLHSGELRISPAGST